MSGRLSGRDDPKDHTRDNAEKQDGGNTQAEPDKK